MIAFAFTFPVGLYHATPWGRNANEADVAWPPEPVRILRALVATWWRKADHEAFPKEILDELIDVLTIEPPLFRLPNAVHSHIRTYMPAPTKPPGTLIYDAFFRLGRDAELIAIWPKAVLNDAQRSLAAHLLERIGYLGRAESWAEGRIVEVGYGEINARPRELAGQVIVTDGGEVLSLIANRDSVPFDATVSTTPRHWAELRTKLLNSLKGKNKRERSRIEATLPERLADALAVDTSDWRKAGWSSPPPLRKVVYDRPVVGPLPPRGRATRPIREAARPGVPEVARFVLAGRPPPRIEDTLRIGEIARRALMSKFGGELPPIELSGRDENGPLRDDPEHAHAFYLPEDADGDGLIDHLIVYCRLGFSSEAKRALDSLTRLWIEHGRVDEEGERGRKEWRLALEDIAAPSAFSEVSGLLRPSKTWRSVTPLLKGRFDKERPRNFEALALTYSGQITGEWTKRFPEMEVPDVMPMVDAANPARFATRAGGRPLSTLAFTRTRRGRGGRQPDTAGGFFQLDFSDEEVHGPIALGWGAHFGLGLFSAL